MSSVRQPPETAAGNGHAAPAGALAPPHNLEAEQSVLGAILLSEKAMYRLVVEERLRAEDFYRERHRVIYRAMLELYEASEAIDVLTLSDRLRQTGKLDDIGGQAAIDALAGPVPVAANAPQYARIVRENALLRRLLTAAYEIQAGVFEHRDKPRALVEMAERSVLEVAEDDHKGDFRKIDEVLHVELEKLQTLSKGDATLTGTPSGFGKLDDITGGFQPGNLIIVAARPSMGKSALVANIAENAAVDHGATVALFSLEMSEAELAQRFIASQAWIKGDDLRKGTVSDQRWPKILEASQRLASAQLWIDDSSDAGLLEIRAKARRLHSQREGGLGLVIIDYLQLMRAEERVESRVEQIGQMSRGLKLLARELNVPVVALSQLNRSVEARTDKRPILSDLRESGSIEQDSDLVVFIYRDDYYNDESERPGEADLIIAKHRNGALGTVTLTFRPDYPKFMNYVSPDQVT